MSEKPVQHPVDQLNAVMRRLRDPESGCPWDLEQTFDSIVPYTIEEVYEVADAIERGAWQELPDELGDLLFQIVFYARLGEEQGKFCFEDVVTAITNKLIRRHPHVFGNEKHEDVASQTAAWETIKTSERMAKGENVSSILDGIAALPGFQRALKLQRKAARVGFDWEELSPVVAKLHEELAELEETLADSGVVTDVPAGFSRRRQQEELGDLLFAAVNLARHLEIDPEAALRGANRKFEERFRFVEQCCRDAGLAISETDIGQLERFWS